ncbi:MAG TPA: class I SAM-dependent methyltransferase [Vicinamibacterales bacterium]|jgi:predicted O-methyltransferase YrrM|nr:class I SAM-dependent methyltransferase [Vicinamibacterales bacterium]
MGGGPLLHFLKWRLGLAQAEVDTTAAERACLAHHAEDKKRVAEVGVWHGGTTAVLRGAMAADGVLYAVDPFEPGRLGVSFQYLIARGEVARVPNGRVVWIRQPGQTAAASDAIRLAAPFDFVFLDPPQTEAIVRATWEPWSALMAPAGFIALHDSRPSPESPGFAPDSMRYAMSVVRNDPRFEIVDQAGLITVLRRRSIR